MTYYKAIRCERGCGHEVIPKTPETYWKAVREDGTDFYTGTVQWAPESGDIPAEGLVVTHPTSTVWGERHATHLCASTSPTDCTGFKWPCRLLEMEPVAEVHEHEGCKVSALSWRVVRELPAIQALGPQGAAVAALIDGLRRLDAEALARLADARVAARVAVRGAARDAARVAARVAVRDAVRGAARDAARDAVRDAVRGAARDAAWDAARGAARDAAWDAADAAVALVVWDLITSEHRDTLTAPIRTALPDLWADVTAHLPHDKELDR